MVGANLEKLTGKVEARSHQFLCDVRNTGTCEMDGCDGYVMSAAESDREGSTVRDLGAWKR